MKCMKPCARDVCDGLLPFVSREKFCERCTDTARAVEYDAAAEWCARHGHKGKIGDPLPNLLSTRAQAEIDADPDAFQERVRAFAYAQAMEGVA